MKKVICLILTLCMLAFAFAACGNDPGEKPNDGPGSLPGVDESSRFKLVENGASEYTLIRSDSSKEKYAISLMQSINSVVRTASGVELEMDTDWQAADSAKKEILIGNTNREETKEVLASLGDYDYAIKQVGNKIVITGKSSYTVTSAVNYFVNEVLEKGGSFSEGYFSLPKEFDHVEVCPGTITIAEGTTANYVVTYTKDCQDRYEYSYYDYNFDEKTVANEFTLELKKLTGAAFRTTMDYVFNEETVKTSPEILLGSCDRDATYAAKAELEYNEYAVKVDGSKLVVTGLGFMPTYEAMYKLIDILDEFKVTDSGTTKYILPSNFKYIGVYENGANWILDIPEYKGGTFDSASDLGLDLNRYIVKFKETTLEAYEAYLADLESAGYTKYATNEIEGNRFATYTSKDRGTLRVQYAPVYSQTSIVVEPSNVKLPGLESENTTVAVTTPKLVQLKISNVTSENGQCHIFRLSDGRFLVFDGGGEAESADLIYEELTKLNVLDGKPVIAAWLFTHHHGDHTGAFTSRFASLYKSKVEIQNYIYSFPVDGYYASDATLGWSGRMSSWTNFRNATKGGSYVMPHAGDVWYFGNMKMTCLYTQDEMLPDTFEFYNDHSTVYMFEIEGQKILITGDASQNVCNILVDMYPNSLKCDILQFPHHGHFGATNEFLDATDPWVVLIPASAGRWTSKLTQTSYAGAAPLRYLLAKKSVKEYYVHGLGTVELDLPYQGK